MRRLTSMALAAFSLAATGLTLPDATARDLSTAAAAPNRSAALAAALPAALPAALLPADGSPAVDGIGATSVTSAINDAFSSVTSTDPALKHLYIFGKAGSWKAPLVWRYNDAGRPPQLSKSDVVAGLKAAAAQWSSACAVSIIQNAAAPDTTSLPQDFGGTRSSTAENVIGWGDLSAGGSLVAGITHVSASIAAGITTLVDADMTLSPATVKSAATLKSTAVHEFGHAIGLSHSNIAKNVMSGPASSANPGVPSTAYTGIGDLQPDDVQGCLCLYGAGAATAGKGYLCGLPTVLDFGTIPVGATSGPQAAILTNRATSGSLTLGDITFADSAFQRVSGCAPGTVLAAGASCTANIAFKPTRTGPHSSVADISAGTLGPYEFPVVGVGGTPSSNNALNPDVVEFYNTILDNYFITGNAAEQAAIAGGSAGPGWVATGDRFKSGGSASVCRFYGSIQPGPNSHFYTIDAGECQGLKNLQAATPVSQQRWNFESMDFAATRPSGGVCPAGTRPVYRAYNNGSQRGIDSNHRITSSLEFYQAQLAKGWSAEGVVMCAPG